jgi:type III secretory pathway component EscR
MCARGGGFVIVAPTSFSSLSIAFHIIEQAIGVTRISTIAILNIQDTQKRT